MKFTLISIVVLNSFASQLSAQQSNDCLGIADPSSRLACYDEKFGYSESDNLNQAGEIAGKKSTVESKHVADTGLSTYRPNYFLPYSYNRNRDTSLYPVSDLSYELNRPEAKFQISFKGPIWLDILNSDINLWFGYTQVSFWQWFNTDLSSPFRESNYEPEAWFEQSFDYELLDGWEIAKLRVGFNHQSNGQEELLSRSWNRVISSVEFERTFDSGANMRVNLKTWKRVSEPLDDDDNPDISRYMGHSEIMGIYQFNDNEITLMVRNLTSSRRGINFSWSFPILGSDHVKGYFQYFSGYGESLIDYNHNNQTIGIGFTISDWLK